MSVVRVRNIVNRFGPNTVHDGVSFTIPDGVVACLIGGSGSGKTTMLRSIIGLQQPTSGMVQVCGVDVLKASESELVKLKLQFGVLFQKGALFSGLTVGENVALPLIEHNVCTEEDAEEIACLKLSLAGLDKKAFHLRPSELSGGMLKRAALARAMATEPKVLFLDEPTSGLDPVNARAFDGLIRTLVDSTGVSVVIVTHDPETIRGISDKIIVLGEGKKIADGSYQEVLSSPHPWIKEYFSDGV